MVFHYKYRIVLTIKRLKSSVINVHIIPNHWIIKKVLYYPKHLNSKILQSYLKSGAEAPIPDKKKWKKLAYIVKGRFNSYEKAMVVKNAIQQQEKNSDTDETNLKRLKFLQSQINKKKIEKRQKRQIMMNVNPLTILTDKETSSSSDNNKLTATSPISEEELPLDLDVVVDKPQENSSWILDKPPTIMDCASTKEMKKYIDGKFDDMKKHIDTKIEYYYSKSFETIMTNFCVQTSTIQDNSDVVVEQQQTCMDKFISTSIADPKMLKERDDALNDAKVVQKYIEFYSSIIKQPDNTLQMQTQLKIILYSIINRMFDKKLFADVNWSGQSKTGVKVAFRKFENIHKTIHRIVIHYLPNVTLENVMKFLKMKICRFGHCRADTKRVSEN